MNRALVFALLAALIAGVPTSGTPQAKKKTPQVKSSANHKKRTATSTRKAAVQRSAARPDSVQGNALRTNRSFNGDDAAVGTTADGRTVYEGSNIGHYVLDEKGNKVYVKEFSGARIAGAMPGGETIYTDSYGNHFYYSRSGTKVYVKKPQ